MLRVQKTGSLLMVGFALSKSLHLHRAYLVIVCNQELIAVSTFFNPLTKSTNFIITTYVIPMIFIIVFFHLDTIFRIIPVIRLICTPILESRGYNFMIAVIDKNTFIWKVCQILPYYRLMTFLLLGPPSCGLGFVDLIWNLIQNCLSPLWSVFLNKFLCLYHITPFVVKKYRLKNHTLVKEQAHTRPKWEAKIQQYP